MTKRNRTKIDLQTLRLKTKIEQHKPQWKLGMNAGAIEGWAVSAPLMAPIMFLLLQT